MAARQGTMGMTARRNRKTDQRLLPPEAGAFFRRRSIELAGTAVIGLGLLLLLACLTFQASDPSLNRASGNPPENLLGLPGAYVGDILLQSLGLVALLLPAILIAWGWKLVRAHKVRRFALRTVLAVVSLLLLGLAGAALPVPDSWPLAGPGLGGVVGDLLLYRAMVPVAPAWLVGFCAFVAGAAAFLGSLGFSWEEYQRGLGFLSGTAESGLEQGRRLGEQGQVALGTLARWRARLERRFGRDGGERRGERRAALRQKGARAGERLEPHLDETGSSPSRPAAARSVPAAAEAEDMDTPEPPASGSLVEPRLRPKLGRKVNETAQRRLDFGAEGEFELPPLILLAQPETLPSQHQINRDSLEKNARLLEGVLEDFGVKGEIVKIRPGPVVTRYELEPAPGIKTSRVVGLADDIARSMSAVSVRVAVVPGSSVIGIELPNAKRETVYLRELLASEAFERSNGKLPMILGKDIGGDPLMADLARMPHLLIAGTTGSGKSVSVNALILCLLYRFTPDRCRFIMIDPKMLELSVYDGIPHLLSPVVTDPKKAVVALKWTVREMEERYRAMSRLGVRNIEGYNARIEEARRSGETLTRRVQTGFDPDTGNPVYEEQPFDLTPLPFIVVVVDEMADLMLVAGKDIEGAVQRLAQMARAAGIHLIMATQRPSVDVITGTIKANFPTRISFHVTSKIDSRTILGETGAEQLLGQGDMLYMAHGGRITRVHGPLVTDGEVEEIVAHLKRQAQPAYIESVTEDDELPFDPTGGGGESSGDDLYDRAVAVVLQHRKASTSFVQRHLQIGYNRAARIIERMESEGLVSAANHVGKREVLVDRGPEA